MTRATEQQTRWAIFLRGVNVGGQGKLPMAELRKALPDIGAVAPQTYIQSGNLTFDHVQDDPKLIASQVADLIEARFAFRPVTLALTGMELDAMIADVPAPDDLDPKFIYVYFGMDLSEEDIIALQPYCTAGETLHPIRATPGGVAVLAPAGIGRSKLAGPLERIFKDRGTARNLKTLMTFRALVAQD